MCGNLEPHPLNFVEVIAVVQKTVSGHLWENLVLQLEVPHWDHGEGFPHVEIYEQHPVIVQHGDFGEQVTVLHSLGNHQVATMVFLPVASNRSAC